MKIWFLTDWLVDCILGWSIDWFNDPLIELLTKFTLFKHISIIIHVNSRIVFQKRVTIVSWRPEGRELLSYKTELLSFWHSTNDILVHAICENIFIAPCYFRVLTFSSWLSILPKITQAKTTTMTTTQQQMAYCLHPMPSIKRERGNRWLEKSWQVR